MLKKCVIVVALFLALCMAAPTVLCSESAVGMQSATVEYYNSKAELTSFWEVGALYGAGVDVSGGVWSVENLNAVTLKKGAEPTFYANFILAELALGKDPRVKISGRDIVSELAAKQGRDGSFSTALNQHIWAMITLDAAKQEYNVDKALEWLGNTETDDIDVLAMELIALSNHKDNDYAAPLIADIVSRLKNAQLPNAAFANGGTENSNTISAVISGLCAAGENVLSGDWVKDGVTMLDALAKYSVGDGSFFFVSPDDEEIAKAIATSQALIAIDDIINGKSVWSGFEVPVTVTVSIRIEGKTASIVKSKNVTVSKPNPTVLDVIMKIHDGNDADCEIVDSTFGRYLSSVNGQQAEGDAGWLFTVKDKSADKGMSEFVIQNGDSIVLYYGSWIDTLYPSYSISPEKPRAGDDIIIKVTDMNSTDGAGIKDVKVNFGGTVYLTDEDGEAKIDDINKAKTYKVNISKEGEGYPAIVRIPEFEVEVFEERKTSPDRGRTPRPVTQPQPAQTENKTEQPAVESKKPDFKDIADISDWALEKVLTAREKGILTGDDKGSFEPKKHITRAEFTAMLIRLLGAELTEEPEWYSDVSSGEWYSKYINAAKRLGLVNGYDDNTFRPNDTITREETALIINRAFSLNDGVGAFADGELISPWARTAVARVSASGIMTGFDGNFSPTEKVTREMAAVIAVRLTEGFVKNV